MTSTTAPTTHPASQTPHPMSPSPRHPIRTAITAAAAFLGLLLLVTLWTVYGPAYDAQAAPLTSPATTTSTGEPCPEGTATGGTCGSEGQIAGPPPPPPRPRPPDHRNPHPPLQRLPPHPGGVRRAAG